MVSGSPYVRPNILWGFLLPLLFVIVTVVPVLAKKGRVICPHSTTSPALDWTQLSTPFAPGPVLRPARIGHRYTDGKHVIVTVCNVICGKFESL